jgi:DNA gyrase subunit A
MAVIEDLLDILDKPERVSAIIASELNEVKREFSDPRKSEIVVNARTSSSRT